MIFNPLRSLRLCVEKDLALSRFPAAKLGDDFVRHAEGVGVDGPGVGHAAAGHEVGGGREAAKASAI